MKKSTVRVVDKIEITRKGSFIYFDFHGTGIPSEYGANTCGNTSGSW